MFLPKSLVVLTARAFATVVALQVVLFSQDPNCLQCFSNCLEFYKQADRKVIAAVIAKKKKDPTVAVKLKPSYRSCYVWCARAGIEPLYTLAKSLVMFEGKQGSPL